MSRFACLASTWILAGLLAAPGVEADTSTVQASPEGEKEPSGARADAPAANGESQSARDAARARFLEASELAQQGEWEHALREYQTAHELYPHATTLYNVGYCHARLGDWASAWHHIARALADARFEPSRRLSVERRRVALAEKQAVMSQLAVVTLEVPAVHAASVDDAPLIDTGLAARGPFVVDAQRREGSSALPAAATLYLNPGAHRLTLVLDERTHTFDLELRPGERRTVRLALPPDARSSSPLAEPPPSSASDTERGASTITRVPLPPVRGAVSGEQAPLHTALRAGGIGALMVGGLGFAAAIVGGVVTLSADSELDDVCDAQGSCPAEHADTVDRYRDAARWTNAGLIVGVAGVATGAGLLLLVSPDESRGVALGVTPDGAYLKGKF